MDLSKISHDLLTSPCDPVKTAGEAREVVAALEAELMLQQDCMGLAAPQIGILKSVAIIRSRQHNVAIDLINPVYTKTEEPFTNQCEGCMSFPRRRFAVRRFGTIWVENGRIWMPAGSQSDCPPPHLPLKTDEDPIERGLLCFVHSQPVEAFGGLVCVAVQHEMDHLAGTVLPNNVFATEVSYNEEGIRATEDKIGRNDPCPCGSGKKYKKCCGK